MAPMAPITPVPIRATTPSLQLASLATATCLLRRGVIQRDQAIGSAGGCTALLERMQNAGPGDSRVVPATDTSALQVAAAASVSAKASGWRPITELPI